MPVFTPERFRIVENHYALIRHLVFQDRQFPMHGLIVVIRIHDGHIDVLIGKRLQRLIRDAGDPLILRLRGDRYGLHLLGFLRIGDHDQSWRTHFQQFDGMQPRSSPQLHDTSGTMRLDQFPNIEIGVEVPMHYLISPSLSLTISHQEPSVAN